MSWDDEAIGGNLRTAGGDGQTDLVKKVPSDQRFIFLGLRMCSQKVFGSRTRTTRTNNRRRGKPWTPEEDQLIMAKHRSTDRQLSRRLGRSMQAIYRRRRRTGARRVDVHLCGSGSQLGVYPQPNPQCSECERIDEIELAYAWAVHCVLRLVFEF